MWKNWSKNDTLGWKEKVKIPITHVYPELGMQEKMTMLTPSYPATEPPTDFTQPDQAQLEADKRAVYK